MGLRLRVGGAGGQAWSRASRLCLPAQHSYSESLFSLPECSGLDDR